MLQHAPDFAELHAARAVNQSSLASLTFLVWDVCITFADEVECVWSRPVTSWTKWMFLFVRYFSILTQIALLFVGTELGVEVGLTRPDACVGWYIFQAVATQILIACADVVLMARVYALYKRKRWITMTLSVLFVMEQVVMAISLRYVVPGLQFNDICIVTKSPPAMVVFGGAALLFQFFLFALTLVKFVSALRAGWGRTPLISLLAVDGTWAFGLILCIFLLNAIFYIVINNATSAIGFAWLLSLLPFSCCRLILNLSRYGKPNANGHLSTQAAELTTHIPEVFGPASFDHIGDIEMIPVSRRAILPSHGYISGIRDGCTGLSKSVSH
ncbi:hypothetical protein JAAARDRAFT_196461 [Jaapia argillacea MUCL 33604]|uniref:DUF6533 domain-containing protein n=1 Tax=Jaapia argillacea MUCL 33604 TaxID=933084 RepID=A0A067PL37_9AGAM|nr:hypothetical protein JAAARDRAFT_196461 [Jaapia argillacea MUCL 33604]